MVTKFETGFGKIENFNGFVNSFVDKLLRRRAWCAFTLPYP